MLLVFCFVLFLSLSSRAHERHVLARKDQRPFSASWNSWQPIRRACFWGRSSSSNAKTLTDGGASLSLHSLLGGRGLLSFPGDSGCPHVSVSEASTERSPCFYRWCFEAQGSWPAGQHPKRLASVSSVQMEVQHVQECDPCHLPGGRASQS